MRYGEFDTASLMYITNRPDLVFERGEGAWLYDHNGKRYLDFIQGWAVNCLGHCPPEIRDALVKQASTLLNPSPAFYNGPMVELAGLLTANSVFDRVFFANTGAEANEGAIKLARKWGKVNKGGAYEIITFDHSFHGRTLATMSLNEEPSTGSGQSRPCAANQVRQGSSGLRSRAADFRSSGLSKGPFSRM